MTWKKRVVFWGAFFVVGLIFMGLMIYWNDLRSAARHDDQEAHLEAVERYAEERFREMSNRAGAYAQDDGSKRIGALEKKVKELQDQLEAIK